MPSLKVQPDGKTIACEPGENVFEVLRREDVFVDTACVGQGTCGLCRVKVLEGADSLPDYTDVEEKHLGNVYHLTQVRLSCRLVMGREDVVLEIRRR